LTSEKLQGIVEFGRPQEEKEGAIMDDSSSFHLGLILNTSHNWLQLIWTVLEKQKKLKN
jgi:hypothetical protein